MNQILSLSRIYSEVHKYAAEDFNVLASRFNIDLDEFKWLDFEAVDSQASIWMLTFSVIDGIYNQFTWSLSINADRLCDTEFYYKKLNRRNIYKYERDPVMFARLRLQSAILALFQEFQHLKQDKLNHKGYFAIKQKRRIIEYWFTADGSLTSVGHK